MERESSKHSSRVDEELKRETAPLTSGGPSESRAQESREGEGPADGERNPDAVGARTEDPPPRSLPDHQLELRRDLARFIEGNKVFPGTKDVIVADAEEMGAPAHVLRTLRELPDGTYEGFPQVWEALGYDIEGGRKHS